ncbi:MAG: formylglycine-generating enzyme family protein [Kiritimatiellia bacterium]
MKIKTVLIGMTAMFVSMGAMAADPTISGVMVQQRWPWSRLVDIDYVLTCDSEQLMDITISAYNGSVQLDVPEASFSGALYRVQRGDRRIVWDPTKTAYTNDGFLPKFRVELTPTPVPLYMIIDLNKSAGAKGQIEYVYETDLTNGIWGAWVRNPVTNDGTVVESVVWTGVTTNDIYKADKIVLRRIPAGAFTMGESKVEVTLSRDFYAGVYEVTQEQWEKVMGTNPAWPQNNPPNPVNLINYNDIRGATNSAPAIDWPGTDASVLPPSFIGLLRAKTGQAGLDLPTEAQWEYACRAGTTTYFNDGINGSSTNQLNELGWWNGNSENTTHPVGLKRPNAWGLYDTHGNVREWCLDWHGATLAGGADPVGPESGTWRVLRNGAYNISQGYCHSAYRWRDPPTYSAYNLGLRLVRTLP